MANALVPPDHDFDEILRRGFFFGRLSADVRAALARTARPSVRQPGDVILDTWDRTRGGVLLDGLARTYLESPHAREVTFRYLRAGDEFGVIRLALPPDQALSIGLKAVTTCRFLEVELAPMRAVIEAEDCISRVLSVALAERTVKSLDALALRAFGSVRSRVAMHLLMLASVPDGEGRIAPVTQQLLADGAGTAREVVARVLSDFRRAGWIETGRSGIRVVQEAPLRLIADGAGDGVGDLAE